MYLRCFDFYQRQPQSPPKKIEAYYQTNYDLDMSWGGGGAGAESGVGQMIKIKQLIQQYNPMLKKQPTSEGISSFQLRRKDSDCFFEEVTVDFKAPFNLNKTSNSIIPAYLQDGNYYTPAFILPRQKEYYERNNNFEKINFEEKLFRVSTRTHQLQNQGANLASLTVATPDSSYCQLCKVSFSSYFDHIQQSAHKIKASQNNSNKYIYQLCRGYREDQNSPQHRCLKQSKSCSIGKMAKKIYHLRLIKRKGPKKPGPIPFNY